MFIVMGNTHIFTHTHYSLIYSRIIVETTNHQTGDQMQSSAVITISNLNRTDDGLYECIAENDGMSKL